MSLYYECSEHGFRMRSDDRACMALLMIMFISEVKVDCPSVGRVQYSTAQNPATDVHLPSVMRD